MAEQAESKPMMEMNTTPLIDVLLVLLIMFIITIPLSTHSIEIDLPTDCPGCPAPDLVKNKIVIEADDTIRWNGSEVDFEQLGALLGQTLLLPVEPELQFEPSGSASYGLTAETLNLIEEAGVTKFGFVGNEKYREFGRD